MSPGPEELQSSVVCWSILENKARDSIKPLHSASPRLRVLCAVKAYTQSKHLLFLHHLTARRDLEGGGCPGTPPASAHCPKCVQLGAPGSPSPAGWRVASPGSEAGPQEPGVLAGPCTTYLVPPGDLQPTAVTTWARGSSLLRSSDGP